jgi:glycosyltransferase involved in cell wall biosynthesis
MKIAVLHDYFSIIGGGEKVAVAIARLLGADIVTTDCCALDAFAPDVRARKTGRLVQVPLLKQVLASASFFFSDLRDSYDFFIFTGNWSHFAGRCNAPHLFYCYTPVRAFYDLYPVFLGRQGLIGRQLFRAWVHAHRIADQRSMRDIRYILAISRTVQERIEKYYRREAGILYPPVETARFYHGGFGDFWLSVNRLYPEKRVELQVEAFRRLPAERLVIVGGPGRGDHSPPYARRLARGLPGNVSIVGQLPDDRLRECYAHARGLVCTSMDEDFGLTAVEAMASGKPVVAVDEGGYREILTRETGILARPDPRSIAAAVSSISGDPEPYRGPCLERAKFFDIGRFERELKWHIAQAGA